MDIRYDSYWYYGGWGYGVYESTDAFAAISVFERYEEAEAFVEFWKNSSHTQKVKYHQG